MPPLTKLHLRVDALIATPLGATVKELRTRITAIKKVYFGALGNARRKALRTYLDAHYDALLVLTSSTDKRVASSALHVLPPVLRPKR